MEGCLRIIDSCHIVFMLPNWKRSSGAKRELEHAKNNKNQIIVYDLKILKMLSEVYNGKKN